MISTTLAKRSWRTRRSGRGNYLPQGVDASSVVGGSWLFVSGRYVGLGLKKKRIEPILDSAGFLDFGAR